MNATQDKRRRDWSIIIFILPLGVVMMMCVGQLAIRMSPSWSVNGDMNSALDPLSAPKQDALIVPPISNGILTPMSWWGTFLTPSDNSGDGGVVFPPFITFEPSATPSVTPSPSGTPATVTLTSTVTVTGTPPTLTGTPTKKPTDGTPTVIATTGTPTVTGTATTPTVTATTTTPTATATTTVTSTATSTPTTCTDPAATNNGGPLPCTYPPTTCTDPAATNNGGPLPCTYPPTTCTDPAATNNGGPLPCTYPPTTCTDPAANNNGGPLPCIFPVSSTPVGSLITTTPSGYNEGLPNGTTSGANVGNIPAGSYVVFTLSAPIIVTDPSETNYDFVYYERPTGSGIDMDQVIISISIDNVEYYVVFNWGDGAPDNNSNVGDVTTNTGTENDNQSINASELHDPDGGGSAPDSGILIDVDNAPSNPPPGAYSYIAIQAPPAPPVPAPDGADVDAIEIVENTPAP